MNQINQFFGGSYRNSFDFLEMDSSNLLEMTGGNYERLMYQGGGSNLEPSMPNTYVTSKPQVPPFA